MISMWMNILNIAGRAFHSFITLPLQNLQNKQKPEYSYQWSRERSPDTCVFALEKCLLAKVILQRSEITLALNSNLISLFSVLSV